MDMKNFKIATVDDVEAGNRASTAGGTVFRCYICGYTFTVGDYWRNVNGKQIGLPDFLTCANCDGPQVSDTWQKHIDAAGDRFWWFAHKPLPCCK